MASAVDTFEGEKGFCWNCGSILPLLGDSGSVKCFMCQFEYGPEVFGAVENQYEIHFHSPSNCLTGEQDFTSVNFQKTSSRSTGPTVERKCVKCGNDTMSYATLQLRSADEGQTVFYTCTRYTKKRKILSCMPPYKTRVGARQIEPKVKVEQVKTMLDRVGDKIYWLK